MRSHLLSDPLDPYGDLGSGNSDVNFAFSPLGFASGPGNGTGTPAGTPPQPLAPTLPDESVEAMAAISGSGGGGTGSVVAETSSSGFTINLNFDSAAMAAPASFRAGIEQAASILSATITNKIAVNINIDYSGTGGGAFAGPTTGQFVSYSTVRSDLIADAAPGDTSFNALPTGSTIQGQSQVAVWNAQLKLFGLISPTATAADGSASFATDISSSLLVGVALHELTHAIGRVPYGQPDGPQPDIFDFYRFTSPGTLLITDNMPASSAYFSLNGGATKIADFGVSSDPSDFLNSGVQGGNDPFNEFYSGSTLQTLTPIDKEMLDALGFNTMPLGLAVVSNATDALQGGAALTLLSSAPNINDPVSATLASATIKIANAGGNAVSGDKLFVNGIENGSLGNGVTASWNATTNTLTLTGTASVSVYDTLLSEITFQDTGTDSSSGSHPVRTVTWTINDGTNSYTATSQATVDRAPVAVNNTATDVVGTTLTTTASGGVLSSDTDLDGDHLTVTGVSDTAQGAGTVGASLAGVYGHLTVNADGSYSYIADNAAAINGASSGLLQDSFTYTVSDGNGGTSSATLDIAVQRPPVLTTANISLAPDQTVAASSLFTVSDPNGYAITKYELWDATSDPNSGHFYFNGVEVADHTELDITTAQLSEVTFVTGTDPTNLEIRAFDGVSWSAAQSALWAPFTVNVTVPPPPVLTTANISLAPDQTVAASSLFTVSDPNGYAITKYELWDATSDPNSGHFYFNGVEVADHTELDITTAQLSEVTFVTGTDPTNLEIRAFDGVSWSAAQSALWAPFTVNVTVPPPPVLTTANISLAPDQTVAASSLFTVSDPNGYAITKYELWDATSDPNSGHFYFNGVEVADHTELDITTAQLSEVTFVTGTDPTNLEIRAFDGVSWSAAQSALWAPFTVNVTVPPPPVLTTANISLAPDQTVAASSLFTVSDPNGYAITKYELWDATSDPNSGHFYFNGVEVADHTELDITTAQLSEVTFVTGTDPTNLEIRAFDGVSWSAAQSALWAPFTVNVTVPPPPVLTTANISLAPDQTVAASSLFTVSDPNGYAITKYELWDATSDPNSGHFYFNGVEVADHTELDITTAQLSEVTFVTGTDPTNLEIRAFDGVSWSAAQSALWAPFTVNVTVPPPPVLTTANISLAPDQTVAASSLFTVSDPNGYAITKYELWDATSDPNSGHFYFNGVEVADHTELDITTAQLSEVTFVTGTDPTNLEIRAFDGVSWSAAQSALWAPFTVSAATTSSAASASAPAAETVSPSNGTLPDNFVFAPNFGQATITNFAPASDTIQIDHTMFANVYTLLAATHDDTHGNAVITDAQHDTITIKNVTTAQLLAHQADFHLV